MDEDGRAAGQARGQSRVPAQLPDCPPGFLAACPAARPATHPQPSTTQAYPSRIAKSDDSFTMLHRTPEPSAQSCHAYVSMCFFIKYFNQVSFYFFHRYSLQPFFEQTITNEAAGEQY